MFTQTSSKFVRFTSDSARKRVSRVTVFLGLTAAVIAGSAILGNQTADAGYGFYGYRVGAPFVARRPVVVARPVLAPRIGYRRVYRPIVPAPVIAPVPAVVPAPVVPVGGVYSSGFRYSAGYGGYGVSVGFGVAPVTYYGY